MHRREQRRRLHPLLLSRRVLAGLALAASIVLGACGEGPATEADPTPPTKARSVDEVDAAKAPAKKEAPERPALETLDFVPALEEELSASLGVALARPGRSPTLTGGSLTSAPAWSTIKVAIALRAIEDAGGPESLAAGEVGQIEAALTRSDNEAAAALFESIEAEHGGLEGGSAAVTEVLRRGGDQRTSVSTVGRNGFSTYGQTDWALDDQARFMAGLVAGCAGHRDTTRFVLGQMSRVTSDVWGLGSLEGASLWKGGWGPDPDGTYVARQMGVIDLGQEPVAIAIAARPKDGSSESAQAAATALAQATVDRAGRVRAGKPVC